MKVVGDVVVTIQVLGENMLERNWWFGKLWNSRNGGEVDWCKDIKDEIHWWKNSPYFAASYIDGTWVKRSVIGVDHKKI